MITPDLLWAVRTDLDVTSAQTTALKLAAAALRFDISSRLRVAHWLAQLAHESGFRPVAENLNYTAQRLAEVWPYRYAVDPHAAPKAPNTLARRLADAGPAAIANNCYAGRNGNGPEASGDGYRFRGRGLIQTTGRANYRRSGREIGFDLEGQPDLLLQYGVAALDAAAYWRRRGLNEAADRDDLSAVTRGVNGRLNGLQERAVYLQRAKKALGI
ncbi:glycoside hydrolase family 19 protein [Deinococcus hopiensis]|uniref:Putative chitinase n=1 Tax=Deinococcus hopiensis KR-140 TaxID=695939 RepID=A0A1W1VAW0_9DEIO|nr:glycoside hydrolase family 19 protein [Deinococcus hopiensis]SMB90607.1 putative chitinase [Deinococcus hopiensis KR-140]